MKFQKTNTYVDFLANILTLLSIISIVVGTSWFFFKLNARIEKNEKSLRSLTDFFKHKNKIIDQHIQFLETKQSEFINDLKEINIKIHKIEKDIDVLKED